MSVIGGPNILEDGLVLYLDAGSGKSFRGEPTTNVVANSLPTTGWNNSNFGGSTLTVNFLTENFIPFMRFSNVINASDYPRVTNSVFSNSATITGTFSTSFEARGTIGAQINLRIYENGSTKITNTVTLTSDWVRYKFENQFTSFLLNQPYFNPLTTGATYDIRNIQIEAKPYATPFVNGTRGTTVATGGGWIDMSRNGNHGQLVNGPIYNGSNLGSLVFDGVDDYISKLNIELNSTISLVNNFTIEQIFKPTAYQPSTYFGLTNMLLNKGPASTYNYATQITNDTMFSFVKRSSGEGLRFHEFTVPNMLNKINIITLVIQNGDNPSIGTVSCYYNGEFVSTISISGLPITANNNDPFYIGGHGAVSNTMFIGQYFSAKLYNKALSSNEVLQNYNALKRRYGL
jgi:hypothetical protein